MNVVENKYSAVNVLIYITTIIVTALMAFPFFWLFIMTFKSGTEIFTEPLKMPDFTNFDNYKAVFETINLPLLFGNTFLLSVVTITVGISITILSSFALTRFTFRFKNLIFIYFLMGLAVPIFILILPIFVMNNALKLNDTYFALILPYIAGSISFNTLLFVGFLRSFSMELEDAAVIDGCGLIGMLAKITVPVMKPAIYTALIFNVLGVWNEYPLASVMINKSSMYTIAFATSMFKGEFSSDYAGMATAVFVLVIPQIVFYLLFQRNIVAGMTAGAIKG